MYFAIYFGLPFQRRNQLGFRKLDVVAEYINKKYQMRLCLMVVHSIFSPYYLHLRQKEIYDGITFLILEDNRIIIVKLFTFRMIEGSRHPWMGSLLLSQKYWNPCLTIIVTFHYCFKLFSFRRCFAVWSLKSTSFPFCFIPRSKLGCESQTTFGLPLDQPHVSISYTAFCKHLTTNEFGKDLPFTIFSGLP